MSSSCIKVVTGNNQVNCIAVQAMLVWTILVRLYFRMLRVGCIIASKLTFCSRPPAAASSYCRLAEN